MAAKVPRMILRRGVRNSPDMLTPARMPVTAGKKMAKVSQNPLWAYAPRQTGSTTSRDGPVKKLTNEATMAANTKYWTRKAYCALFIDTPARTAHVTKATRVGEWVGKKLSQSSTKPII